MPKKEVETLLGSKFKIGFTNGIKKLFTADKTHIQIIKFDKEAKNTQKELL